MFYLVNFLFAILYYKLIFSLNEEIKARKIFFILLTFHLVLFRALSNPYNYVDTLVYAQAFNDIVSMPINDVFSLKNNIYAEWGIGYVVSNWLVGCFSHDSQILFMTMAVIGIIPVTWFIYKTSNSMLFPIVVYLLYPMFFYMSFGVIRQHIAVGFILLALYYVDSIKVSLFWALLAFSFHTSACVFLPFYIWHRLNNNKSSVWKSILFVILTVSLLKFFYGVILASFDRYQRMYGLPNGENNIVPVIFIGSFVFLWWFTKSYKKIESGIDTNIINFMIYGLAISIVGIGTPGMGRMSLYFMYALPVSITYLDKYSRNYQLSLTYKMIFLSSVVYLLIDAYITRPYAYSFYWENVTRTW